MKMISLTVAVSCTALILAGNAGENIQELRASKETSLTESGAELTDNPAAIKELTKAGFFLQRNRDGNVYSVSMFNSSNVRDDVLRHLQGLPQLRRFSVGNTPISDAGLEHLGKLKNLESLVLNGRSASRVTDAGVRHLGHLPCLKRLHLQQAQISDAGVETIKNLTNLEYLSLSRARRVSDDGVKHLIALTNLNRLNLRDTAVTDEGVKFLTDLTQLEYLNLDGTKITDACLPDLKQLRNLRTLTIRDTAITEQSASILDTVSEISRGRRASDAEMQKAVSRLMDTVKKCGNCGARGPATARAGQRCPSCGVVWTVEIPE